MKVIVLGASGMLGSMVLSWLGRDPSLQLIATGRETELFAGMKRLAPTCDPRALDAESATVESLEALLGGADWAVNCIGVIKPYIKDDNPTQTQRALRVNSLFPHLLAQAAERTGCKVLQIATDCVYSGLKGAYPETAAHDALDVYGKSKSLGEVHSPQVHHLRCSIIGPEPKCHVSLLDWFLGQAPGAGVKGFTNHDWNGVTTLHYAKVCHGIMKQGLNLPHLLHVVPTGTIAKSDLLGAFATSYGRGDITIDPVAAPTVVDRTLSTGQAELNAAVWRAAGYPVPPTVPQMVQEMADYGGFE
jgi:dTDP-4-dehydrorhamnose reductase